MMRFALIPINSLSYDARADLNVGLNEIYIVLIVRLRGVAVSHDIQEN